MQRKRVQVSPNDICFLKRIAESRTGRIAIYEVSQMYNLSVDELQKLVEDDQQEK
jgi:hypothetical protein